MLWALTACRRGDRAEYSFLLEPLKDQLDSVWSFVDIVSEFLQENADHMRDWRKLQEQSTECSIDSLISGQYHTNVFSNKLTLLSTGEEESEEVREFFVRIEELIQSLQSAYMESSVINSSLSREVNVSRQHSLLADIISNEEVKAVNGVLACMKDLVEALRSISASTTRLRAFRDIRLTQSGTRKVSGTTAWYHSKKIMS
jgi:hypothetical protein